MSDAIVRLKVESQEYDQKLKRATEGLTRYADECRKVGGTLEVVEQEMLDYVRALGKMDTVAKTTNGSLSEMKKTYTELSMQYRKMTDEEKKGEYGQALRQSLDQLQGRIKATEADLKGINNELSGSSGLSGALDNVTGKLGINIKQLTLWGAALGAGKVALDVAKDAFFASEATVDEWGRTVAASESIYQGFLNAINTGDISGYLNRIDDIVKAARIAYDELDRLGTMQRIQSPQKSAQQTENERMRMMIQTGRYIAPVDGRSNAVFNGRVMQNGDKLTAGQIRAIEKQLQGGLQKTTKLIENEVKQTTRAISALYDRESKEIGLSRKEFMAGTSSMAEFDKRMAGYQQYQQWRSQHTTIDQQSGREIVARGNPYQEYAKWGNFRVDGDRYNQLVQLVLQREQQMQQAYSMQGQTYRAINRAEGFNVRQLLGNNGGTGGSGGGKNEPDLSKVPFDINKAALAATKGMDGGPSDVFTAYKDSLKETTDTTNDLIEAFKTLNKAEGVDTNKQKPEPQGEYKSFSNEMANITQGVSGIVSGIEQLGIDIPEGLKSVLGGIQAVAGILTGISALVTIITAIQGTKSVPVIGWMLARGGVVHAAGGYQVPGNRMSGDQVPAMLNSGELVLNKAQQGNLASQLSGSGLQNLHLTATVHAEQIRLALNNNGQRTGRGELVTWKR